MTSEPLFSDRLLKDKKESLEFIYKRLRELDGEIEPKEAHLEQLSKEIEEKKKESDLLTRVIASTYSEIRGIKESLNEI